MTAQLLESINESCERKSQAVSTDKTHDGSRELSRSRLNENDPHRLRSVEQNTTVNNFICTTVY